MSMVNIVHWNDVYRVAPQKISPTSSETIDVTQFAVLLDNIRNQWSRREDGKKEGLSLFSGDVFSPSVESSVTRGSHMVPVMNELSPDVSLTGNHDFDFGYPHLSKLIQNTKFPWLLSNITDNTTSQVPQHLHEFCVFERGGVRIGVIGLVEKEWIATVPSWPSNFEYRDMTEVGMNLSKRLRDPAGEHQCDLVVALTHSRVPNDISLAKSLFALSPALQEKTNTASLHGVDLILGGHDHLYYVSKGVSSWENYDITKEVLGAEDDNGDVLIVKSGCDFRDLSEISLELSDTPKGSIRKKVIKCIKGKRHTTKAGSKSSEPLKKILAELLSSVGSSLKAPVCITSVELNVQSTLIRTSESAAGNWFADVLRHCYDDALCIKGCGGSDGVLICAGTLRGDSIYGPGPITLGDILEILPFEDPLVVLELDGEAIWAALESSLETWPAQEGRFPIVSGLRVSWDSRRPAGQRVLGVWQLKELAGSTHGSGSGTPVHGYSGQATPTIDGDEIRPEKGGRKYNIVTREYMAQGHDGFLSLKGQKYLIDDETGQLMSAIVRKYLMGSHYVNKMARQAEHTEPSTKQYLHSDTHGVILREKHRREKALNQAHPKALEHWKRIATRARSKAHYQDQLNVSSREHMSTVDCFDGAQVRSGNVCKAKITGELDEDLLTIHPVVDGRMKDEGRN